MICCNFLENKFWLELPSETPAFLCERVGVELELCRVADMTIVEDLSRQRRSMLYVSRGQLKKHSNTALNLSLSIRYISQQVSSVLCFFFSSPKILDYKIMPYIKKPTYINHLLQFKEGIKFMIICIH